MDKKELAKHITKVIETVQAEDKLPSFNIPPVLVEFPERKEHGDYSTNVALLIGKNLNKNPMEVAGILADYLRKEIKESEIEKVEALRPGFINFFVSKQGLLDSLEMVLRKKGKYGSAKEKKTLVIDYSAPNIAKTFGIGHLRSTIIGQAIYNIYKFLGWKCIGDNHLGDWGTQFGKLIVAIKTWNEKELKDLTVDDLENLYVRFHKEAEIKPELLKEAREWFRKLEKEDKEAKKLWKICVDVSLKEFNRIYETLGIKIDYALGESFYEKKIEAIIKKAKNKGIAKESQGALVIPLPGLKTPLMLLKSDRASTYETRELATIKYRVEKWKPDLIIWEVGADQKFHFEKSFKAAEMLGYGKKEHFFHVAHGLIRWPYGKFSTRRGDTIHLEDILKEAIGRAGILIEQSKTVKGIFEKEKKVITKQVGIGAIKYNDLSRHYSRDIIFDWESILSLEGNSGPYLQYAAVRCQSVLRKVKFNPAKHIFGDIEFNKDEEDILRTIRKFPEVVKEAAKNFSPNLICNFAFDLSQKYNIFYEKHPILTAKTKEFRLALTAATKQILENSLALLGISIPDKM